MTCTNAVKIVQEQITLLNLEGLSKSSDYNYPVLETVQVSPEPRKLSIIEPPHHVEFTNDTGTILEIFTEEILTNEEPRSKSLDWLLVDNSPVTKLPGLRRVLGNNSLEFLPFPAERFRHDVHTATYRCRLRLRSHFAILSKNIHLHVPDEYVMSGNTAILRCLVPSHYSERVASTDWFTDDDIGVLPYLGPNYERLDDGSLYISSVSPDDRYTAFRCRIRDRISGNTYSSKHLVRPRLVVEVRSRRVPVGHDVRLPCAAHAWPVPTYRWFREHRDELIPIEKSEMWPRVQVLGGLLSIRGVGTEDGGRFVCWFNNSAGSESVHFTLITAGYPIEVVYWIHDGKSVKDTERIRISEDRLRLHIKNIQINDQGIYQCFASNTRDQAYGISELLIDVSDSSRLVGNRSRRTPYARSTHIHDADWNFTGNRESKPELVYWFSEQTLQPGPSVSLKCVAMGHPPPQFSWLLDGFPIPSNSRFVVGQHVTLQDDVVSHLNISRVTEQDGGEYACVASNTAGKASHAARVNVYGLPYIREMSKVTAVAGSDLNIKCPVAGYPIETITWERDGQTLPLNRRQKVFPNGTLIVEQTQRSEDAGTYTCQATNRQRHVARREVEVQILVQPKILPIQPLTNLLREGMRAAISCQILEGDLPIAFRWEKNGQPVTSSPYAPSGIMTRRMDEYSASLVIEHITSLHSGNYTCIASNVAGSERFTVPLTVNVPPRWRLEPGDMAVAAGQDVILQCQADGYPKPTITWKKAVGKTY
ncbi:unnamed protein product [Leptidea sinapis]|uniref:Ig-like domain-containing protein n=1 Tax=Leptidea sinapis TaxID=189913 RepID=A0A5E4QJ85_9NEOP|nr:unnamed protein product [Leptidea sinapis]